MVCHATKLAGDLALLLTKFAIRQPDTLIGLQCDTARQVLYGHTRDQVKPVIRANQVDITQRHLLYFVADIVNAENRLIPPHTLTPEAEQLQPQV